MQVFPLLLEFQQEFIKSGEGVPVNVAKVVARGVVAVIGKFYAHPSPRAAALGFDSPGEYLLGDNVEVLQLFKEFAVEGGLGVVHIRWRSFSGWDIGIEDAIAEARKRSRKRG